MAPTSKDYRNFLVDTIKASGQELIDRADTMIGKNMEYIGDVHISIDICQDCFPELTISVSTPVTNMKQVYNKQYK